MSYEERKRKLQDIARIDIDRIAFALKRRAALDRENAKFLYEWKRSKKITPQYCCMKCHSEFVREEDLSDHMKDAHPPFPHPNDFSCIEEVRKHFRIFEKFDRLNERKMNVVPSAKAESPSVPGLTERAMAAAAQGLWSMSLQSTYTVGRVPTLGSPAKAESQSVIPGPTERAMAADVAQRRSGIPLQSTYTVGRVPSCRTDAAAERPSVIRVPTGRAATAAEVPQIIGQPSTSRDTSMSYVESCPILESEKAVIPTERRRKLQDIARIDNDGITFALNRRADLDREKEKFLCDRKYFKKTTPQYCCMECKSEFVREEDLSDHLADVHPPSPVGCSIKIVRKYFQRYEAFERSTAVHMQTLAKDESQSVIPGLTERAMAANVAQRLSGIPLQRTHTVGRVPTLGLPAKAENPSVIPGPTERAMAADNAQRVVVVPLQSVYLVTRSWRSDAEAERSSVIRVPTCRSDAEAERSSVIRVPTCRPAPAAERPSVIRVPTWRAATAPEVPQIIGQPSTSQDTSMSYVESCPILESEKAVIPTEPTQ